MGQFTRTFKVEIQFDGDNVVCEMKRLRNEHMVKLAPFFVEKEGITKITFKDKVEMLQAGSEVLPDIVVSITGLKDSQGNALGLKDILGEMWFNPLIDELVGRLFIESTLKQQNPIVDPKKSDGPSPDAPAAHAPETIAEKSPG
jgi:hypothetical protein